jgi:Domain of unknown function (DUF1707)/2TM domain
MDLEPSGERRRSLRASDADRERVVDLLRQAHAEGRLTAEEFDERMGRAFEARTYADLDRLTTDLPAPPRPPPARQPVPSQRARESFLGHLGSYLAVNLLLVGIWAATGHGYFWPIWPMLGWGFAVVSHALSAYLPGDQRERDHRRDRGRRRR